jgi:hypothetical protein
VSSQPANPLAKSQLEDAEPRLRNYTHHTDDNCTDAAKSCKAEVASPHVGAASMFRARERASDGVQPRLSGDSSNFYFWPIAVCERPIADCRAVEKRPFAPKLRAGRCIIRTHLITSSARNKIDCGIAIPSAFAVFMFTTRSNFVGCSTGRSPAFAPFSILSTNIAPCFHIS